MAETLVLALLAICMAGLARVTAGDCLKPPRLEYGSPTSEFISLTSFPVGAEVIYNCYLGYLFQEGSSTFVTCQDDSTWTPLQATCEPKDCGNPGDIENGYFEAPDTTFGERATYHCDAGYNMVGSDMRLCTHDGWNGQVPTCKMAGFGPVYRYQETITYKCNEGFEMMGDNVIECNEDSTFVPPPPTCKHQFPPINIFKEMIAMGRQLIIKEESMIKTNYRLLESQREILRLKEKIIEKAEQYIDEN
uniref:complement decay-accelerating factor-like isoform X2 n=1 Tax=Pristiophorus japonicus TaxID=55135 RepID=UPI00398F048D